MILWNQHNVGDAGIRSETRYQMFYRREHDGPLFYVPVVRGTNPRTAVGDVVQAFGYTLPEVVQENPIKTTTFTWHRGQVYVHERYTADEEN